MSGTSMFNNYRGLDLLEMRCEDLFPCFVFYLPTYLPTLVIWQAPMHVFMFRARLDGAYCELKPGDANHSPPPCKGWGSSLVGMDWIGNTSAELPYLPRSGFIHPGFIRYV